MKTVLTITGLDKKKTAKVVEGLNELLANMHIYYSNLRGFHWNIKGKQFFELHEQFENTYNALAESIDEVAERILQLGSKPENRYSKFLSLSSIAEEHELTSAEACIDNVIASTSTLIKIERNVIEAASEAGDEVSLDLMVGLLAAQEKLAWMLSAYKA